MGTDRRGIGYPQARMRLRKSGGSILGPFDVGGPNSKWSVDDSMLRFLQLAIGFQLVVNFSEISVTCLQQVENRKSYA